MRAVTIALGVAIATPASAATIHGLVYDDANGDGLPSAGEPGIANAVVAFGVQAFVTTDGSGQFDIDVADGAHGIVWVRVPDGFVPGPVWARWQGQDVDLGLHRLAQPAHGPLTFVVAADTHVTTMQDTVTAAELATAALEATALDPAPAFFTILGDITQGNREHEFELVDAALTTLTVPFVPVPGNHDWYDGGAAWFAHYGPDNYSFDIGDVHFVVWNMAMKEDDIRRYLGAELARVPSTMTVVALTHAPPFEPIVQTLRELGVDYVLVGHTHTNRVIDHDGLLELSTEPMLMGGLDFTPAGYRVVTIDHGRLASEHRTTLDEPLVTVVAPARGQCMRGPEVGTDDAGDRFRAVASELVVAAALDAGPTSVTARIDCATPIALRPAGGWDFRVELPPLRPGPHSVQIDATAPSGEHGSTTTTFEICDPGPAPLAGVDWLQLGGDSAHRGASPREVPPPLVARWTTTVGGHVLSAPPVISRGVVYVAVTDLADGNAGGIVALDAMTGIVRWRMVTALPVRGGIAVVGDTVVATQIDGVVLGLHATTGAVQWRHELSLGIAPQAGAVFAPPSVDQNEVLVGHQRTVAALAGDTGRALWTFDPVPEGVDSQSAAAIASSRGLAVGVFNRAFGGLIAWDRATGQRLWNHVGEDTVAINASPVMTDDTIFVVSGADEVTALDLDGEVRWRTKLDPAGFDWGNATIGTPALAHGFLIVPTLYRDLVALDAQTGAELWRYTAMPSPLHATHYRGAGERGFEASPIITGDVVWAVDTSGELTALELATGRRLWHAELGVPVLSGLATNGEGLVIASYDGTVRLLVPTRRERAPSSPAWCDQPADAGCCDASGSPGGVMLLVLIVGAALARRRS